MGGGRGGIIGVEGDPADLMYLGVVAVVLAGSFVARLRAAGMARAMTAAAAAVVLVGLIALAAGEHRAPHTSVLEIGGLTALFAGLFAASAWWFRSAVQPRRTDGDDARRPRGGRPGTERPTR